MAWLFSKLIGLTPGARSGVLGAGVVLLVFLGVALGLAWEHRTPWGLEAKRADLLAQIEAPETGWRARLETSERHRLAWMGATERCENQREKDQTEAADAIRRRSEEQDRASSAAFNQGYAAGRAVGLQQCGVQGNGYQAPSDGSRPGGSPGVVPDGQTDLARLFGTGSYIPRPSDAGGARGPE